MSGSPTGGVLIGAVIGILIASGLGSPREDQPPSRYLTELKTENDLSQVLASNEVVVVDFYSDRSLPSKKLRPTINELAAQYAGRVAVVAVNLGRFPGLRSQYNIADVPEVRIFKAGKLERSISRSKPKRVYEEALDSLLPARTEAK